MFEKLILYHDQIQGILYKLIWKISTNIYFLYSYFKSQKPFTRQIIYKISEMIFMTLRDNHTITIAWFKHQIKKKRMCHNLTSHIIRILVICFLFDFPLKKSENYGYFLVT